MAEQTPSDIRNLAPRYKWGEIKEEEIKTLQLPNGQKIEQLEIDGLTFGLFFTKIGISPDLRVTLPLIKQMDAREDDVLICAYQKAGTHWIWEITKMLKKGKAEYEVLPKESGMLEFHEPGEFDIMASPKTFNTHNLFRHIPKQMLEKKCKIIFVQRNPKDVAVSFFNHLKAMHPNDPLTFGDYVLTFGLNARYTGWYDYTLDWEKNLRENPEANIYLMNYEDLKQDPVKEIKRLAEYLEVKCDDQLITDIANKCDFQKLKAANYNKEGIHGDEKLKGLSNALYRKGQVGDWKNWFTVAQNEQFDAEFKERMKDSKYEYKFVL